MRGWREGERREEGGRVRGGREGERREEGGHNTYQMRKDSINGKKVSGTINHNSAILEPRIIHNLNDLIDGRLQLGNDFA